MRLIEVACSTWVDLLGYGAMLQAAKFDPTRPEIATAIKRLHAFHGAVAAIAARARRHSFPTLVLNDGAVAYRDLSPRSRSVTFEFLCNSVELHKWVNQVDQDFYGARTIIAVGFRVRRLTAIELELTDGLAKAIKTKLVRKLISPEQAVNEALRAQRSHDLVPNLQANFAFTKAFLADRGGRAVGLQGAECYIDLSLFTKPFPPWISFSRVIEWSEMGMSAQFGQLKHLDARAAHKIRHQGVLDAFDLAERLSDSSLVVPVLRSTRVRDNLRRPLNPQ